MAHPLTSFVDVKVVTWLKDSHGLFDYESKNIDLKRLRVDNPSNVYKEDGNIVVQNSANPQSLGCLDTDQDYLFSLTSDKDKKDKFYISSDKNHSTTNYQNNPFVVIRSLKTDQRTQKGYELEAGDVVRFGRVEYRVLEYRDNASKIVSVLTNSSPLKNCPFDVAAKSCTLDETVKKQCRICLMDENDTPEALVNPCSCKGTSEHVHIACLQSWINMKMKKKVNADVTCTYWKKLNCEVCKVPLPDIINLENEKLELVPIERPETPYIVLERLFNGETKDPAVSTKMIIHLTLANVDAQIKLGRGHECDIRENDISVSRFHAYMKFQNGKFVLFDNNSKFGTLVLLRKDYLIDKKKIALQIGRTVVAFSLKQTPVAVLKPMKQLIGREKAAQAPRQQLVKLSNRPGMSLNDLGNLPGDRFNFNGNFLD